MNELKHFSLTFALLPFVKYSPFMDMFSKCLLFLRLCSGIRALDSDVNVELSDL